MLEQFLDAWNQPATRHAMLVHFPIVLSIVGVPLATVAALIKRDRNALQWTSLAIYLALVLTGAMSKMSGEEAEEGIEGSLDPTAETLLETHETLAEWVWIFAAAVAALLAVSLLKHRRVRLVSGWLAVAGGLFVAGWIANTADHGGRLVYDHGAGTRAAIPLVGSAAGPDAAGEAAPAADPRIEHFRTAVRPVLVDNCLRCHNPRRARRAGRLDQTTMAGILAGGMSGPAVVPGNADESLLIIAVRWDDPDLQMPRGGDQLDPDEIAALVQWVNDGAVWEAFTFELGEQEHEAAEDEGEHEDHGDDEDEH